MLGRGMSGILLGWECADCRLAIVQLVEGLALLRVIAITVAVILGLKGNFLVLWVRIRRIDKRRETLELS